MRALVDAAMTLMLLLSMSYELAGFKFAEVCGELFGWSFDTETFGPVVHEVLGIALILLFVYHLRLNRYWLKGIFKGKYDAARFTLTAVNVLLIADVVMLAVSGLMMSRLLSGADVELEEGMSFARTAHMLASYWGFVLMSFHAGMNWNVMKGMMLRRLKPYEHTLSYKLCANGLAVLFIVYGVYAFINRGLSEYMLLRSEFVFFDFYEPFMYFVIDYAAIMIMFGCLGHYTMTLLRKVKR